MKAFDFDLFVIGAGSGGVRAARIAAGHGARVAIAEESRFGGTCVIRGCVPKKLLMYTSQLGRNFAEAAGFGWRADSVLHDWSAMMAAKNAEIVRLENVYAQLLADAGVTRFRDRATIAGLHLVELGGKRISAKVILIATGAKAVKPDVPGADLMITSDDIFEMASMPRRIAIVGAGYIACEFAGIFSGLGSRVTQLYRGEQVLRGFDGEVREHLGKELVKSGIDLKLGTDVVSVARAGTALRVELANGEVLEVDAVLAATGRRPNTRHLGLEAAEVELTEGGAVKVDEYSQTTRPGMYAVGDVTDRLNLTPVAIHEGHAFADTVFGSTPRTTTYDYVPFAVFSQPQVAAVGLTEEQARGRFGNVKIFATQFKPMRTAMTRGSDSALVKLVVDAETDKVVGAHIVAADAAEVIQAIAIAMSAGATKRDFDTTIGVHPTLAEELVTLRTPR
ncbi:glutathione-disulfide reductase [Paraburkholderia sp. CNPSo 3076]|uniref:glutathione-disulfide reductase n=1 Tax=Paraburkholderia sp. CNPSo 3076 TaxID=2940936 RepID=UPI00224D3255|nr:glutathione-disulfide reductase [Paraburkholderia sp. CNPSo 3076]MCX5544116.1 glutathione-disulfide reductase [Paraburkholderia sp. CNPSo 3076]